MVFLSFLILLNIDPFLATICISSICIFYIFYLFHKNFYQEKETIFYIFSVIIFLNIGQITGAALYGFSTIIFCTVGLALYISAKRGKLVSWSILSIIFCLFRPEAVIFFLPSIFVAYKSIDKDRKRLFYYLLFTIITFGLVYFIWRYLYFNHFLPLPLEVKQYGGELSIRRFFATISQLLSTLFISFLIPIAIYFFVQRKRIFSFNNEYLIYLLLLILSCFIYLISLSSGFQSQNIFFRYFSPLYFIVFLISIYSISRLSANRFVYFICLIMIAASSIDNSNLLNRVLKIENINISFPTTNIFKEFTNRSFKNHPLISISKSISEINNDKSIMVTEAGALPFFSNFKSIDLIGLNHNKFAFKPVTCDDINFYQPSFVEIDIGPLHEIFIFKSILENDELPHCGIIEKKQIFIEKIVNNDKLILIETYNHFDINEGHKNAGTYIAPQNVLYCMKDNQDYDRVFINKSSDQIYFLKNNDELLASNLEKSCSYSPFGYFQIVD